MNLIHSDNMAIFIKAVQYEAPSLLRIFFYYLKCINS
jgi:hypothetical protein